MGRLHTSCCTLKLRRPGGMKSGKRSSTGSSRRRSGGGGSSTAGGTTLISSTKQSPFSLSALSASSVKWECLLLLKSQEQKYYLTSTTRCWASARNLRLELSYRQYRRLCRFLSRFMDELLSSPVMRKLEGTGASSTRKRARTQKG